MKDIYHSHNTQSVYNNGLNKIWSNRITFLLAAELIQTVFNHLKIYSV